MTALPALPVAIPLLVAAALVAAVSFTRRWMADAAALITAVAVTALCALLLVRSAHETIVYWFAGWQPRGGIALEISFAIDPIGAGIAAFAGVLTCAALIFSWRHFEEVSHVFHALMLVFLAAMVGFSLSGDLFNMFEFFADDRCGSCVDRLPDRRAPAAGRRAELRHTNTVGGFLIVGGIGLTYGRTGALNLAQVGEALAI